MAPLRVLIAEDNPDDAELVVQQLRGGGWDVTWERVETPEQMRSALERASFDLIVSDYQMPRFRAPEALALWKERGLDVPFIVCSGTIGEEQAVEVLKAGAHDFFLKDRLARLPSAVAREVREAAGRRTLRRAEEERAEAVRALGKSERDFQDLFESAPDATVIVDARGLLRAANRQAKRLFGYEWEELDGQPIEMLVPSPRHDSVRRLFDDFVASPAPRLLVGSGQDLLALRKDGSTFPVEISLSPMTTDPGVVIAAVRDITDRRRLEQQLRQVQKMEAVGRLAGGVAHDFNNVLGVILGHAQLLLRHLAPDDAMRARAEQVLFASERGAALTRQLLAFSRQQPLEVRTLDLNAIIGGVAGMLGRLLGEDITLEARTDPGLGHIQADATEVEQILMNLAVNARDAMPDGGRLLIETANADLDEVAAREQVDAAAGRYVRLTVSDTGHGMTREVQARVFEPFFTTKEPGKGTGLGLATIYGIVKHSNGFIRLDSAPGQGTTFTIFLPRVTGELDPPPEPLPAARGAETVLLVEDDPGLRELVGELLRANGYHVILAAAPSEALAIVKEHEGVIHLLLTDVVMPALNGRELAQRARELRPDLRILFMSGYTADIIAKRSVRDADVAFIAKPFKEEALTRRVREVLDAAPALLD
jgi:two-component system, cell cycle sensor histidine kinase and response regulator CckA